MNSAVWYTADMPETTFERRGTRTLVILLILRLFPSAVILVALLALISVRGSILTSIGQSSPLSILATQQAFTYTIQMGFLVVLVIAGVSTLIALLDYYGLSFNIEENSFRLKEGIINIREISLSYRQIQNIDISRPLLYRMLGMSKVVILTAGTEDMNQETEPGDNQSEAVIDLIDKESAEALQHELLERSHVQVIRNAPLPAIDLHTN